MHNLALLIILTIFLYSQPLFAANDECLIAESAIEKASQIRGLKIKHKVPCLIHNREQVKQFLLETINTKIPAKKLEMEGLVFKALGFLPDDFNYKDGLIELYVSQIGGYYDPDKAHYVMAGWLPSILQTTVAVHELTHALQDQYFNLKIFTEQKDRTSDELIARSALVEGDATAVMLDYSRQLVGEGGIAAEKNVQSFMVQNVLSVSMMTGMTDVPQSLQFMLLFPYNSGLRFAHELLKRGSYKKINQAFGKPPRSTEEILHPEKYFVEKPDFIRYQAQDFSEKAPALYTDTLGEFSVSALLISHLPDKAKIADTAAGWGGDQVAVFPGATADKYKVIWKTNWDSGKDADEFFNSYAELLKKGYPASFKQEPENKILSGNAAKKIELLRQQQQVQITIEL